MKYRTVYKTNDSKYRIVELPCFDMDLETLKGDCYNAVANPDIDAEKLRREELRFEARVENEGVWGYVLESWDATPGHGYEHLDSCWGFVGMYNADDESCNHYIVSEMKETIKKMQGSDAARVG